MEDMHYYQEDKGEIIQTAAAELSEYSTLVGKTPSKLSLWARRYRSSYKCVSSKAGLLVLLWTFLVITTYGLIFNRAGYMVSISLFFDLFEFSNLAGKASVITALYTMSGAILCFYPLAGYLADNKFGRYKTVIRSLYVLLAVIVICDIFGAIIFPLYFTYLKPNWDDKHSVLKLLLVMETVAVIVLVASTVSLVGFNANVIQFGMDQLHDSPADHQSLFIHWYMWVYYLGIFTNELEINMTYFSYSDILYYCLLVFSILLIIAYLVVFVVSLCIAHHKRNWFIVDPARPNPYKLVYRVTKFAHQHKVPVHRSAFTFCEDEVPSGLDLGKDKYGGPFTTEQVEDVKAFFGILKVLFALSPVFFFDIATDPLLYFYAVHGSQYNATFSLSGVDHNHEAIERYLLQYGLLSPMLKVFGIPLYLCLLRPFISRYIPGMLKRMGVGISLVVASLICTFLMDTAAHAQEKNANICMFSYESYDKLNSTAAAALYASFQDTPALVIQRCLGALSDMLIYIALYEFVCAQSPHSMKGLLIGLSFAMKGFFETIAAVVMIPFFFIRTSFPSCGMDYYLMNICLGVVSLLLYIFVARRYKFRERDEPCNVRRYVEDYYFNNLKEESPSH